MEVSSNKSKGFIQQTTPFLIELAVILFLSGIVIALLNYLKIIDLAAFFTSQQMSNIQVQAPNKTQTQSAQSGNSQPMQTVQNLSQPNLNLIIKTKSIRLAQTISEFDGKIISIDTTGGKDERTGASYSAKLVIEVGAKDEPVTLFYSQKAIDKIKVQNSAKKVLSLKELVPGEKVRLRTNTSLLRPYPNNVNEVLITIL